MGAQPPQARLPTSPLPTQTGGAMELFMIKTGFYDKVTAIEAERLEAVADERRAFERALRAEVARQAADRGVTVRLPPPVEEE